MVSSVALDTQVRRSRDVKIFRFADISVCENVSTKNCKKEKGATHLFGGVVLDNLYLAIFVKSLPLFGNDVLCVVDPFTLPILFFEVCGFVLRV